MILTQRRAELEVVDQKFPRGDVIEATELSLKNIRLEILTLTLAGGVTLV